MQIPSLFGRFEAVRPRGKALVPVHECILDVVALPRELTEWCWAAVAQAIFVAYRNGSPRQCDIVKTARRHCVECCRPRRSAADRKCCNNPDEVKGPLGNHCGTIRVDRIEHTQAFVKRCIDGGFPIVVRIAWTSRRAGAGHFVIIRGYRIMPGDRFEVHVADPQARMTRPTPMAFADFLYYYEQDGEWDISYETQPDSTSGVRRVPPVQACT